MCVFKRVKNSVCRQLKEVPESLDVDAQGPASMSRQTSWPSWHSHGLSYDIPIYRMMVHLSKCQFSSPRLFVCSGQREAPGACQF